MSKLSEEIKLQVANLAKLGETVPYISKTLLVSPASIHKILKEYNIKIVKEKRLGKRRFTIEEKSEMIRLYLEDQRNTNEIANLFNTYNTSVRRVLLAANVPLRGYGVAQRFVTLSAIKAHEGTLDFDYFLGLLATDGCITSGKVVLEFSEENKELLDYWNEFLGNKCNITCSIHKIYKVPQYRIAFRNPEVIDFLSEYGIVSNKTFNLRLKYLNWDVLRGIIDGDGCISLGNNGSTLILLITSGHYPFILQIKNFLEEQGIKAYIYLDNRSLHPVYSLRVYKSSDLLTIYNNLYSNAHYFLKRKLLKFGPLLKKFNNCNFVNSGKETCDSNPEPSPNNGEGVETLHEASKDFTVYDEEKVQV